MKSPKEADSNVLFCYNSVVNHLEIANKMVNSVNCTDDALYTASSLKPHTHKHTNTKTKRKAKETELNSTNLVYRYIID